MKRTREIVEEAGKLSKKPTYFRNVVALIEILSQRFFDYVIGIPELSPFFVFFYFPHNPLFL